MPRTSRKRKGLSPEATRSVLRRLDQIEDLVKALRHIMIGGMTLGNREWLVLDIFEKRPDAWFSPTHIAAEFQFLIKAEEVSEIIGELIVLQLVKKRTVRGKDVFTLNETKGKSSRKRTVHVSDDPMLCEHPNEAPNVCPCGPGCYCKTRTCAPRK